MFTQIPGSGISSGRVARLAGRIAKAAFPVVFALALVACGGGGGSSSPANPEQLPPTPAPNPAPQPQGKSTANVHLTTTSGAPVSGASVNFNGTATHNGGRSAITDANGTAQFNDLFAGESYAVAFVPGYHGAGERFVIAPDSTTDVTLTLVNKSEATPVFLGAHPIPSSDGRTLTLDLDIAVLDANGAPIETLTASDFGLNGVCDWYWCVFNVDGTVLQEFGYNATVTDATFSPSPILPRPAIAAAVLLDQSAGMRLVDPSGLRLEVASAYFQSIAAPDTVALGSYQGIAGAPTLTTYGEFTSDGGSLQPWLAGLKGQERGTNPLPGAVADMITYTASHTAAGSSDLQRSVVTFASSAYGSADCGAPNCAEAESAAVEAARTTGISVVAIGTEESPAFWIAARTGGASALVQDPAQLPAVFHSLNSIIAHHLAFTRVRMQLDSGVRACSFLDAQSKAT